MKELDIKCPNCGGKVIVDPASGRLQCSSCGEQFSAGSSDDSDQRDSMTVDIDGERIGYDFERGRQRASVEFAQGFADAVYTSSEGAEPPRRRGKVLPIAVAAVVLVAVLSVFALNRMPSGGAAGDGKSAPVAGSKVGNDTSSIADLSSTVDSSSVSETESGPYVHVNTGDSSTPLDIEVVDSAYDITPEGFVHFVVALHNPNEAYAADFVDLTITGRREDGTIAFSDDWTVGKSMPGSTTYWASLAGNGDTPDIASVEFRTSVSDYNWEQSDYDIDGFYSFSNISASADQTFGRLTVTGEITLNEEGASSDLFGVSSPMIVCVLRDADGNMVSGFSGFIWSDLAVGDAAPFEIESLGAQPEYSSLELYAYPW